MTPVRAPAIVRGDVPGLFKSGTEATYVDSDGASHHVLVHALCADGTIHATTPHGPGPMLREYDPRDLMLDWHLPYDPMSVYRCLHWLADRGHPGCLWMLPTTHGGRVEAWDELTAWGVSAILVSVSVGMVAAGRGPIIDLVTEVCWGGAGLPEGIIRYRLLSERDRGSRYSADVGRVLRKGPKQDERPHMRESALADGCCLRVPGGLLVPV